MTRPRRCISRHTTRAIRIITNIPLVYAQSHKYAIIVAMSRNDTPSIQELQAIVHGTVQGVGFRYFVVRNASALGLRGYTRNDDNGDVEVVAQGPRPALERLLAMLHRGPSAADVYEVQTTWRKPTEHFSGFHVRY